MTVTCDAEVGAQACGVSAAGRCDDCHRAFCASHMNVAIINPAIVPSGVAVCRDCGAKRLEPRLRAAERSANEHERKRRAASLRRGQIPEQQQRLKAIVQALNAAGNPGARTSRTGRARLFDKRNVYIGWPVGSYVWQVGDANPTPEQTVVTPVCQGEVRHLRYPII